MKFYKQIILLFTIFSFAALSGCQPTSTNSQLLNTGNSQVQLRSIQSRAFDTTDKNKTLRTIIATLQDLGFVMDKADETLGSVTATKLKGYQLQMSVTVRPRGKKQLLIRANANDQIRRKAIEDPMIYQDFFISLEKAMFLAAHKID